MFSEKDIDTDCRRHSKYYNVFFLFTSAVTCKQINGSVFIFLQAATMASFLGRIFLVTGATDGIGKHTATKLAQTGATVLIHGRNQERLEQTAKEIKKKTKNNNLTTFSADFSSLGDVRNLSDAIHQNFDHLDVLINNAGVFMETRQESADGHEMTFAVNVLAPFLLTSLLLDLLKKGSDSRIVNVSSISHEEANEINFDDLQLKKSYGNGRQSYALSKLCEIMFTYEMSPLFKDDNITVNCLDPGSVNTKMLLQGWGSYGIAVDEADKEYRLATDAKFDGITGIYFVNSKECKSNSVSYDKNARKKLWDILVEMTGANF